MSEPLPEWVRRMRVQGLPPDDWPGLPGADWGMGSRVEVDGRRALVVGAIQVSGPLGWEMYVRFSDGREEFVCPARIASARQT